ncbi:MAG TPA: ABC-type transport auxiliary lipoprotein family protein [Methyloceanibacter sp.]|jgi:cholesterol transport system auxiliary component
MFRPAAIVTLGIVGLGLAGCAGSPPPTTYDIVASRSFAASPKSAKYQLAVSEPVAATPLDTNRIMVKPSANTVSYYKGVAWGDRLPRLVQARMVETIQNSGAVKSVGTSSGDYTLSTELRSFQIDASNGHAAAEVELFAKLVNNSGKVVAQKSFTSRVNSPSDAPTQAVAALNQAFTEVMQDTTTWVVTKR